MCIETMATRYYIHFERRFVKSNMKVKIHMFSVGSCIVISSNPSLGSGRESSDKAEILYLSRVGAGICNEDHHRGEGYAGGAVFDDLGQAQKPPKNPVMRLGCSKDLMHKVSIIG